MRNMDEAATSGAMFPGLGFWTAILSAALTAVYIGLLGFLMLTGDTLPPDEPLQTILHILILLCLPVFVFLCVLIHDSAPMDRKIFSLASVAFIAIFAALVAVNRFVALTVEPQGLALGKTAGLAWFMPYEWPSVMLAIEMLGWGFFFGLAWLSAATVFQEGALEKTIFWTLVITALLNLASSVALVINQFNWIGLVAPLAWGLGPIAAFILIAIWFHRQA